MPKRLKIARSKPRSRPATPAQLRAQVEELQQTLDAIRHGEVDALIVHGPRGQQVYSLTGAEQPYRIFLEQMREGAVMLDAAGSILYANTRFAEMVGRPLEKVIGSLFRDYISLPQQHYLDALLAITSHAATDLNLRAPKGALRPTRLTCSIMPLESGQATPRAFCLIATDLTEQRERKLLDETLNQLRASQQELRNQYEAISDASAALQRASTAKDDFLAALSHELRTPLNPVLMTVASLAADASLPAALREDMQMIRRNIDLEARLIDDLLDITRITRGKLAIERESADLHDILTRAIDICHGELGSKRLRIAVALRARRHFVRADPVRIQQALWNIIRNAIKFTPSGGVITITTANTAGGGQIRVAIADTGIGIAPHLVPNIFKAFEQGDASITRQFGGLGLGLAISHKLVELHQGQLTAASKGPGRGATFTLTLPTSTAPPATSVERSSPSAAKPQVVRILLVEDHDDTRRNMKRLLAAMGHSVDSAASASEALHLAAAHSFDLLISDLGLPDRSGYELIHELRRTRDFPAICLSGYGMEDDISRSREAGFLQHLTKPINLQQLEAAIHQAIIGIPSPR